MSRTSVGFILLASSFAITSGCGGDVRSAPAPQAPSGEAWLSDKQLADAHVVVSAIGEERVGREIVTNGRVTFDDQKVTHVFSPVTGRVVKVLAQPGEHVTEGTPLATLASPDLQQAFSDLRKAEADFVAAERERSRQKELFDAHAGAQRDLEAAESTYDKAKAELERARGKILVLGPSPEGPVTQEYVLRSPIAGDVIARSVNPGTEVQGQYSGGTAVELFTIGKIDQVWALGDVYEVDLPKVKTGSLVVVKSVAYPDRTFQGTVDWISGAFDPVSRTAKVRCSLQNQDHALRPEMYVSVSIAVDGRRALAVPRTAVLRLGDQMAVFVEKGRSPTGLRAFESHVVTVNDDGTGELIAVTNGLSVGDRIVTSGAILLAGMI